MTQPNAPNQQPPHANQPPHPGGQQPYPQPPGYGFPVSPPPPPAKKRRFLRFAGFGCAGVLGLVVVIAALSASGDDSGDGGNTAADSSVSASAGAKENSTKENGTKESSPRKKEAQEGGGPVKVTAERAEFSKSILADGSDYTSVRVTVVNDGDDEVSVNPLYFTITDTDGTKHTAELGVDEEQIDTVDLAPGENISGTVTGKGTFTPKYVTYTDGLLGDPMRVNVS
ncbi:DUF4352 domain-containing protein [Streptomyces sp. DSM 41972]|uniref:DUF4352 domain-containing protein n=1 Tax=Streptomyces althioticus subsp. attaecolombicae TaxID=3075534 RepID=A0ABU3HWP4_9ACTN|nr:DUF4352 domain-containing protein [Streptomyces sp. DSM 41972]SCD64288.1 protein of unknown function [Streptomyces sp. di50b]SCD68507.1 protein of unknown function [Streptomyces sp. di188]